MAGPRPRLVIVGGGRMGEALLGGLLATEWARAEELAVSEKLPGLRAALSERHPGIAVGPTPVVADGTVLAVKPDDAESACRQVAEAGAERLLSIVTGVPIERLEGCWVAQPPWCGPSPTPLPSSGGGHGDRRRSPGRGDRHELGRAHPRVRRPGRARARAPAGRRHGALGIGSGLRVPAGRSADRGRGPERADLGPEPGSRGPDGAGLGPAAAGDRDRPESLRSAVVSPGGTTAAGLAVLESRAVRGAILEAVAAATDRAHQLGLP